MAKRKQLSAKLIDRFSKKDRKQRRKGVKDLKVYFLIVCEGSKTEPNYFRSFPKQVDKYIFDLEFGGGGISTIKVVDEAINKRDRSSQKFDRVWAVFDKDSFKDANFNEAIHKGERNGIKCAWSNEAFELWYLLHFQYRHTAMSRTEYEAAITDCINDKKGTSTFKYRKNNENMYHILQECGDEEFAIINAERLERGYYNNSYAKHNPRTTVFKLVKELRGMDDELNNELKQKYDAGE